MKPAASNFATTGRSRKGEPWVWLTAAGLTFGVAMALGLFLLILFKGGASFWPRRIDLMEVSTGAAVEKIAGYVTQETQRRDATGLHEEIQVFRGNKDLNGEAFKYIDRMSIKATSRPESLLLVERLEYGPAIVTAVALESPAGRVEAGAADFQTKLADVLEDGQVARKKLLGIERKEIGAISRELEALGRAEMGGEVPAGVAAARRAYDRTWSKLSGADRGKYLFRIARLVQERARELAVAESLDNGKPIKESRDVDIPLVAAWFFYYAGWADKLDYAGLGAAPRALGVAAQVIPWNFPLLMLAWKIAPALATGNTVVLKPAETTSLTALLFAEILQQADLPKGVVNIITGAGDTGQLLVDHPGIDKVAFTGSTAVGRAIARSTAAMENATSSASVDQLLTEMRRMSCPCQCEPDIQTAPSAMSRCVTARVRSSEPNVRHTCVNTTSLMTETPGSAESPVASAFAFATRPSTRSMIGGSSTVARGACGTMANQTTASPSMSARTAHRFVVSSSSQLISPNVPGTICSTRSASSVNSMNPVVTPELNTAKAPVSVAVSIGSIRSI